MIHTRFAQHPLFQAVSCVVLAPFGFFMLYHGMSDRHLDWLQVITGAVLAVGCPIGFVYVVKNHMTR